MAYRANQARKLAENNIGFELPYDDTYGSRTIVGFSGSYDVLIMVVTRHGTGIPYSDLSDDDVVLKMEYTHRKYFTLPVKELNQYEIE